MLLNRFGQPIPINIVALDTLMELDINDLATAPLLLTGGDVIDYAKLLNFWKGDCVYSSKSIFEDIKPDFELHIGDRRNICMLPENVPTAVQVSETETLSVTMIPIDAEAKKVMFLIKDKYTLNLITDVQGNCLKAVESNSALRNAISEGIDMMYINDYKFFAEPPEQNSNSVFQLRALVAHVCPITCKRLLGVATTLFDFIDDYNAVKDLYSAV